MKIKGIKAICHESKGLYKGGYGPGFLELFFDEIEDRAFAIYQVSRNSWTQFKDENIIACGWIIRPATMKEIKDQIESAVKKRELECEWSEQFAE